MGLLLFWAHGAFVLVIAVGGISLTLLGPKGLSSYPLVKAWISSLLFSGLTLMHSFWLLPALHSFLSPIQCLDIIESASDSQITNNFECWGTQHIIYFVSGLFFAFLLSAIYFISLPLFYEDYYFSPLPWAGENHDILIYRGIFRFVAFVYMCLDPDTAFQSYGIVILFLFQAYLNILIFSVRRFIYKVEVLIAYHVQEGIMLTFFTYLLQHYLHEGKENIIGIFGLLVFGSIIGTIIYFIKDRKRINNIFEDSSQFKLMRRAEIYLSTINWVAIMQKATTIWNIGLSFLYSRHRRECRNESCVCNHLVNNSLSSGGIHEKRVNYFVSKVNLNSQHAEGSWPEFIELLLLQGAEKWRNSQNIMLEISYFESIVIKNYFKSYYWIVLSGQAKGSFTEMFRQYRMKQILANNIIMKESKNQGRQALQVILKFQKLCLNLQKVIQYTTNAIISFWKLFGVSRLNLIEIFERANKIAILLNLVSNLFEISTKLFPNYPYLYFYYGHFLRLVVGNEQEASSIIGRGNDIFRNRYDSKIRNRDDISKSTNTAVIIVSGNVDSLGIILQANQHVKEQLGFTITDLEGRNISRIIPTAIGEKHDEFLLDHFRTGMSFILGDERMVFVQTKEGLIEPICIMVKTLPCLVKGIRYIGFLRRDISRIRNNYIKIPSQYKGKQMAFLMSENNGNIVGFSKNACSLFGLSPKYIMRKKGLTSEVYLAKNIAPEFGNPAFEKELQSGMTVEVNTKSIIDYLDYDFLKKQEEEVLMKSVRTNCQAYAILIKMNFKNIVTVNIFGIIDLSYWEQARSKVKNVMKLTNELQPANPPLQSSELSKINFIEEEKLTEKVTSNMNTELKIQRIQETGVKKNEETDKTDKTTGNNNSIKRIKLAIFGFVFILLSLVITIFIVFMGYVREIKTNQTLLYLSLRRLSNLNIILFETFGFLNIANGLEPDSCDYQQNRSENLKVLAKKFVDKMRKTSEDLESNLLHSTLSNLHNDIISVKINSTKISANFIIYNQTLSINIVEKEIIAKTPKPQ